MSTLVSLLLLIVFLASGFVVARLKLLPFNAVMERIFSVALYLLLFSMGLRLGQSRDVLASLPLVGSLAICGALFGCAGSVILHLLMKPVYLHLERSRPDGNPAGAGDVLSSRTTDSVSVPRFAGTRRLGLLFLNLKKPMLLLALVALGTVVGFALPVIPVVRDGTVATWILYFLLFIIGVQMAGSGLGLRKLLFRPMALILPAVTIVGTLLGSLGTLAFAGMTPGKSLALGAGFGWYSLSGVLISNLGDPSLGAASFLANLFRETFAFLAIPALRATGRCESGIGIAGATSMDVTLPIIEDTWGSGAVPLSVAHGVVLSFLVPFLVPLFMSF
jgi:uncharacterized membrane protein YbjE (DUF340 family)